MSSIKPFVSHEEVRYNEKFLAILKSCRKINSERDLVALLDRIAREATRLTEADRASIFLLDREKQELWSQVALGTDQIRIAASVGVVGAVVTTGQMINVKNVYQDIRFYPKVDTCTGYRTQSLLAVPLRNYDGEIIGAFEVLNKKGESFTEDDEETLEALAAHAAIAIETAQLIQELRKNQDKLLQENRQLWKAVEKNFSTQNIIGTSEKIQRILRIVHQVCDSSVDVLITGESGTGKDLLARAIHYNSLRARNSLITLNCAALPESLVESELFGIEKGVATGVERRTGKFEAADGSTLFLDEIGDLSLTAQAKILRVLQERVVDRVGGSKAIPVDVRILAATNKDLEEEIRKGTFRQDLYYRLKVIHICIPPLREIREDIPLMANYFLAKYCQEMKKEPKKLASGALECLMNYCWPGNVRELENEIKRLVILIEKKVIAQKDLSETIRKSGNRDAELPLGFMPGHSLKETMEQFEKRLILEALQRCRQNQQRTAKALGLSRQGLIKKMKRYGIKAS